MDACIILVVIVLNAIIGVIQEFKAEKAIDALEKLSEPKAYVLRDGYLKEINSEDLVVGDIVELEAGRYIPADMRLLTSTNLKVEESTLTGESEAIENRQILSIRMRCISRISATWCSCRRCYIWKSTRDGRSLWDGQ